MQKAADAIEELCAKLKNKPFPATEPPEWITDPARKQEWWDGYNKTQQQEKAQREAQARFAAQSQPAPAAAGYAQAWANPLRRAGPGRPGA